MNSLLPGIIAACVLASPLSLAGEAKAPEMPGAEVERQLLKLEHAWTDAEIKRDKAALRRILDDRFVATFGGGAPYDKEGFIKAVVDDDTDTMISQDVTDRLVRVDRDTAVVVETDTIRGITEGKAYIHVYRITTVYIKRGGRWVALAEHLAQASPPK